MDVKTAIDMAGGATNIVTAFGNRGIILTQPQVSTWKLRNTLPKSEWFGSTSYAAVICDLISVMGYPEVSPIDLCPGAGQYMAQPDTGEA